jgi:hypothetical protein
MCLTQPVGDRDPLVLARRWHPDVGQDRVRELRVDRGEQRVTVLAGRDELELGRVPEQVRQGLADEVRVVRHDDPQRPFLLGRHSCPSSIMRASSQTRPWWSPPGARGRPLHAVEVASWH